MDGRWTRGCMSVAAMLSAKVCQLVEEGGGHKGATDAYNKEQ